MGRVTELYLRATDRPLVACVDTSRLGLTGRGGITGELRGIDFVPDLPYVGGIRVKLVSH